MNIVVTIKQVTDPSIPPSHIQFDATGKRIVSPFGIRPVINGYDANALEEALRLKEKHGGRVTALGLGDDTSRESLKLAIAMGADNAILLNDPDWLNADSASVGRVLAAAISKIGNFHLVLCGRQASDTDGGQVLHWIAETLNLPGVTPIAAIEESDDHALVVRRLLQDGYQRLRVELPALLGVSSEINEPRYPRPRGIATAARSHIPGWKAGDLAFALPSRKVELRKLEVQLSTARAQLIDGSTDTEKGIGLADKLHELGFV